MTTFDSPESKKSFISGCIQLYGEMMNDIKICKQKNLDKLTEIQCCFDIATNYGERLLKTLKENAFESIKEEIFFFKKLKPLFTAEAEFYTYYYHTEIFKNTVKDGCELELELFYRRQLLRMNKFKQEQPGFYTYMESEQTSSDMQWFTCLQTDKTGSSHDKLLSKYWAIKRYIDFIQEELKKIGADITPTDNKKNFKS